MRRRFLFMFLAIACLMMSPVLASAAALPDGSADVVSGGELPGPPAGAAVNFSIQGVVLYDNGPLITHGGGGGGGANASALQTALGMSTYGWGHQVVNGNRIADDFTVPAQGWNIDEIIFYAYQTGSPTSPSPFTAVNYRIWDGPPNNPASTVVFGDTTTNMLTNTTWSYIYRALDTGLTDTNRPIMANTVSAGIFLPAGTYWLDWQTDGSLASGPWAPPVTILGQTTTGNALQYASGTWNTVVDGGTGTQQDFPFLLIANQPDLVVSYLPTATAGKVGSLIRRLSVKYRVMNQGGSDAAASELDFYLSRDTALNVGDVYVGTVNIPALAPGEQAPLPYGITNFLLPVPASAVGTWKVLGVADANNDNDESDETNNVVSAGTVVMGR